MSNSVPAWYGDVDPPMQCSSCGHEMFDAQSDPDAGITFCPKCGRQTVDVSKVPRHGGGQKSDVRNPIP